MQIASTQCLNFLGFWVEVLLEAFKSLVTLGLYIVVLILEKRLRVN